MLRKYLVLGCLLALGGCTTTSVDGPMNPVNPDQNTATSTMAGATTTAAMPGKTDMQSEQSNDSMTEVVPGWKHFDNRAKAYGVNYPASWFWQHWIASEVTDSAVKDVFVAHPSIRPQFNLAFRGQLGIDVLSQDRDIVIGDFKQGLDHLSQKDSMVVGIPAVRLVGTRATSATDTYAVAAYIFRAPSGETYRIWYAKPNGAATDLDDFERFVASFRFVQK